MTARLPLVFDDLGNVTELQPGDTLLAPTTGGTKLSLTNDNGSALPFGTPVYVTAADHVDAAKADASSTKDVLGLVADATIAAGTPGSVQTDGLLTGSTGQWDLVCGTSGGLVPKTYYFLSAAAAGKLTAVPPATQGQWLGVVGYAISPTEMLLRVGKPVLR